MGQGASETVILIAPDWPQRQWDADLVWLAMTSPSTGQPTGAGTSPNASGELVLTYGLALERASLRKHGYLASFILTLLKAYKRITSLLCVESQRLVHRSWLLPPPISVLGIQAFL